MIDGLGGASKRKMKKSTHTGNKGGEGGDDSEEEILTRLEAQPSILKGGLLRDY